VDNKPKPEKTETKLLNIMLPEKLLERVKSYCSEQNMTVKEFVTDAIIEKLNLAYKERRKKGRM
jgi:predicted DNA binding CopG/RHH family protein